MANPHLSMPSTVTPLPMLELSDHLHDCVYRPSQQARMPLLCPTRKLTPSELDVQLAAGRRRSGSFVYYTACPTCSACEPARLHVQRFQMSRSMKRVLKMGDQRLGLRIGLPSGDASRLDLFNRHRLQRNLAASNDAYTVDDFHGFLVESCCDTYELSFWDRELLVACTIVDVGLESVSAVYTYFDPCYADLSPGTYSILKQIEWTAELGKRYLYLGMYVADNQHLRYKARFTPQDRFVHGEWITYNEPMKDWSLSIEDRKSHPEQKQN